LGCKMTVLSMMVPFFLQIGILTAFADDLVRRAQESMVEKGIDPGPIDGIWGPLTRGGVIEFQKRQGLTVSGRLDDATKKRLFSTPESPPSDIKTATEPSAPEKSSPGVPMVAHEKQKKEEQKASDVPEAMAKTPAPVAPSVDAVTPEPKKGVGSSLDKPSSQSTESVAAGVPASEKSEPAKPAVPESKAASSTQTKAVSQLPKGVAGKGKYEETTVSDGGSISGVIHFSGKAPAPIMEDLNKGKNVEFCATHPDTREGNVRPRVKVVVTEGILKDTVVFIQNIEKGKAWPTAVTNFDFKTCDIFPKVSVVRKTPKGMKTGMLTITNQDPEILHNPHGYSVAGANRKTLFNKPLPSKGDVADVTKSFKRFKVNKDKHFFLQCDQHNFMEADARVVWNPYHSISGADGAFKIEQIPAGKYWVTAWHPYIGEVSREVTVSGGADVKTDFELFAK